MIVFPLTRSVRLKGATASSRTATLPMFVRSRLLRARCATSLSCASSGTTTKSIVTPPAGRASVGPVTVTSVPPARITPAERFAISPIDPSRGPRQLITGESRGMNPNHDIVYRCLRLGPLHQLRPRRSRSLIRYHNRLHGSPPCAQFLDCRVAALSVERMSKRRKSDFPRLPTNDDNFVHQQNGYGRQGEPSG